MKTYIKKFFYFPVFLPFLLAACINNEPKEPYIYEKNPQYTWGYAVFYGDYYAEYGNENNVLSISLFTNELGVDNNNYLIGTGQYLYLEDVFVTPTDTLLPDGIYTIDKSGESFTISPGEHLSIDGVIYTVGATITYLDIYLLNPVEKLITEGTMNVSRQDTIYTISCNFKTDDNLELKGNFTGILPHFDQSLKKNSESLRMLRHTKRSFILSRLNSSK
ncbi:MAG TPA: hypothetical protein PK860_02130 [Paludibacteraceae bacterium]|nr:hypothetical protein [Paludibacteraceae bacterium]